MAQSLNACDYFCECKRCSENVSKVVFVYIFKICYLNLGFLWVPDGLYTLCDYYLQILMISFE